VSQSQDVVRLSLTNKEFERNTAKATVVTTMIVCNRTLKVIHSYAGELYMSAESAKLDRGISSLIEVTDAILSGDYNKDLISINTEGVLQDLANKINAMLLNLKSIETPLTNAGDQAPTVVDSAVNVVDLMRKTAGEVLDKSDHLSEQAEILEEKIAKLDTNNPAVSSEINETIDNIKNDIFDVIATQTFQDVARQKMEVIIKDLNKMRDWLIESLVVLNIRKNDSPENIRHKTEILKDVKEDNSSETEKQDLVDDLLAEFGF